MNSTNSTNSTNSAGSTTTDDLYLDSKVIKLFDKDFVGGAVDTRCVNENFHEKNGYIMIYAPWCPNCQNKVDFWSYMADQFNDPSKFADENFRIGVVNCEDPNCRKISQQLKVTSIPRVIHVNEEGKISDYNGSDLKPKTLLSEACRISPKSKICHKKNKKYTSM